MPVPALGFALVALTFALMVFSAPHDPAISASDKGAPPQNGPVGTEAAPAGSGTVAPGSAEDAERMDIFGDIMYLNEDGTRVVEGHLVIDREGMKLWADRGTYNEKKSYSTATGNVKVVMDDTVLTCGYLEFFMTENKSIARINPKIVRKFLEEVKEEPSDTPPDDQPGSNGNQGRGGAASSSAKNGPSPGDKASPQEKTAIMVGREIEIFHDENRVKAVGNAIVTQYVESGKGAAPGKNPPQAPGRQASQKGIGGKGPDPKGELKVTAESIELFTDVNRLVAVRNVKIVNNDITAVGNKAIYSDNDGILDILGNARTWQNANLDSKAGEGDKKDGDAKGGDGKAGAADSDKGKPEREKAPGSDSDGQAKSPAAPVPGVETPEANSPGAAASLVHINDLEGGHAEAERAVYNAREEVLDLIGSAKSWQEDGINLAQGDRIRYFLKDKRSVIIDARIKHYPGSEGEPGPGAGQPRPKSKKKSNPADKSRKSAEEAALDALRALD